MRQLRVALWPRFGPRCVIRTVNVSITCLFQLNCACESECLSSTPAAAACWQDRTPRPDPTCRRRKRFLRTPRGVHPARIAGAIRPVHAASFRPSRSRSTAPSRAAVLPCSEHTLRRRCPSMPKCLDPNSLSPPLIRMPPPEPPVDGATRQQLPAAPAALAKSAAPSPVSAASGDHAPAVSLGSARAPRSCVAPHVRIHCSWPIAGQSARVTPARPTNIRAVRKAEDAS